jgi:hypothetical protein
MLNGVKSRWDGELSHSWREQRTARSLNSRLPPVRQRRRRIQVLAQEAFAIFVATGDNLIARGV